MTRNMPQEIHLVLVSDDPTRVYPAFQLAMGATSVGLKSNIYCTQKALEVVRKGRPSKISLKGYPPFEKLFRDALSLGVKVYACAASRDVLKNEGITEQSVEPGIGLEDLGIFLKQALPAAKDGGIITFV